MASHLRRSARLAAVTAALALVGCATAPQVPFGGAATSSSTSSSPAGRTWRGTATLASATPMSEDLVECLTDDVTSRLSQDATGSDRLTLTVGRPGAEVTASLTSDAGDLSCDYTGATDAHALTLTSSRCSGRTLSLRCGAGRDGVERAVALAPLGSTVSATTIDGRLAGTVTRIYGVEGGGELILGYAVTAPAP